MADKTALLSLMRLVSPALPVGAYSYSQGFEAANEAGWVHDRDSTAQWLRGVMQHGLCYLDIPVIKRCYQTLVQQDNDQLAYWNEQSLAARESAELRLEDKQMGKALLRLLSDLGIEVPDVLAREPGWLSVWSFAAWQWQVELEDACHGYLWAWLENQLAAAAKLVPLGQTDVQRLTTELLPMIGEVVTQGLAVTDDDIGMGMPRLVIGSMLHETQYSRLFRS